MSHSRSKHIDDEDVEALAEEALEEDLMEEALQQALPGLVTEDIESGSATPTVGDAVAGTVSTAAAVLAPKPKESGLAPTKWGSLANLNHSLEGSASRLSPRSAGDGAGSARPTMFDMANQKYKEVRGKELLPGERPGSHQSSVKTPKSQAKAAARRKFTVSEFILYVVFLALFTAVIFSSRDDQHTFFFTELMRDLIIAEEFTEDVTHIKKSFKDVATAEEYWQWFQGPLMNALYAEEWYNGDPLGDLKPFIYGYNRILGLVRVRQVRVKTDGCEVPVQFSSVVKNCYPKYSSSVASDEDYLPSDAKGSLVESAFKYHSAKDKDVNGSSSYWGRLTSYSGDGFLIDLTSDKATNLNISNQLIQYKWIDLQTRAVFVDFTVYNANLNLFCIVRIVAEFPATGGVIPSSTFRAMKVFRYNTSSELVVAVVELIFVLFILYYIVVEIREIMRVKWGHLKEGWNFLEDINLPAFVIVIVIRVYTVYASASMHFDPTANRYTNFQGIGYWIDQERNVNAVNAFLCWFKVFKYLQVSTRLSQLSRTLSHASKNILSFLGMFFIVFLGFATAFNMAFGVDVKAYRSVADAMFNLFIAVLGDFDFISLRKSNRVLGPFFFVIFQILVFFVMMNMFLAIINRAYEEVTRQDEIMYAKEAKRKKGQFSLAEQWKKMFIKQSEDVKKTTKALGTADQDGNGKVDEQEMKTMLRGEEAAASVFGTKNAKKVIQHYDMDHDGMLDSGEIGVIKKELKTRQRKLDHHIGDLGGDSRVEKALEDLQEQVARLTATVSALK